MVYSFTNNGKTVNEQKQFTNTALREETNMKQKSRYQTARLATVVLGGALALALSALAFSEKPSKEAKATPINLTLDERPVSRDVIGKNSYSPIVKQIAPAVVKVFTSARVQPASAQGMPEMDDFFRRFFGEGMPKRGMRGQGQMPRQHGIGSGVIVTKDGYILTNNHVVEGADEVKVALQDGQEFNAKVIGRDPKSEVAVIKINADNLPVVPMADSDKVEVGDIVLAVGNPFGIGQTVTTGIVSATGRGGALGLDYEDFIQTDAAINPGNSGGALVDTEGRLVGINTAILSRSGGNQGIGFAIPTNLAKDVMESLVKDGEVSRGYMGVMIQDLNPTLKKKLDLKEGTAGALVGDVSPKSPAEKAGLKSGDVVLEFNGKKISDSRHLKLQVARTKPGETVPVKILRDGEEETLNVKVKELPGSEVAGNSKTHNDDTGTLNGVAVADIDSKVRKEMELPSNLKGVIITEVKPDSAAAEAGLRPGDVILEINRKSVKSAEDAVAMTEKAEDKTTLLRVWREGNSRFVVVDESKAG
jgi:serine protease Do